MACAAVKRHYDDGETSASVSTKPKRFCPIPMETSPSSSPMSSRSRSPRPRTNCVVPNATPFPDLSTDALSGRILEELHKISLRRAQRQEASENSTTLPGSSETRTSLIEEQPLFSLSMVRYVCSKLLKEREAATRSEYDRLLSLKLAEQYETFVKFAQDQIDRRGSRNGECSYFS